MAGARTRATALGKLPNTRQVHLRTIGAWGCSKSLIYRFLRSYAHQNRPIQTLPVRLVRRPGGRIRLKPWHFNEVHWSRGFGTAGCFVRGFGTGYKKQSRRFASAGLLMLLTVNEVWSHPPESNRRPPDYEEYSPAPNSPLILYGCA
jgi:hypothetical protein